MKNNSNRNRQREIKRKIKLPAPGIKDADIKKFCDSIAVRYPFSYYRKFNVDLIRDALIENENITEKFFRGMTVENTVFRRCRILVSTLKQWSFTDTIFDSCDFSNTTFDNCRFIRCASIESKFTGGSFLKSLIYDFSANLSIFKYTNINDSRMEYVKFFDCDFTETMFRNDRLFRLELLKCMFKRCEFLYTSLSGVDFSSCSLIEPRISEYFSEFRGAKVSITQTAEIAKILGTDVVDDS